MNKANNYYILEFELKNLNNTFLEIKNENIIFSLINEITNKEISCQIAN